MNYLISTFDCVLVGNRFFEICEKVKYKLLAQQSKALIFPSNNGLPFVLDLKTENNNLVRVKDGFDNFYFLFNENISNVFLTTIKYKNKNITISLSGKLFITLDDRLICEKVVDNLSFSHFEIVGDLCLIYFSGKRNYLVVLKDNEICFSNYYDECNIKADEKCFMCRLNDSLNHGHVCEIKNKEFTQYLVYLDDEDLNLKEEFLPLVFIDCVKAGNFKYCNALLSESLKLKDEKEIKNFFPEFDFCFPINERKIILIKKNTLVGIYTFDIQNSLIINIVQC